MCPPKKGKKVDTRASKDIKKTKAQEEIDAPKAELTPGVGWTLENFKYLKTVPAEKVLDEIYVMFGIPAKFKGDRSRPALQVFAEFHQSSYVFASQFPDPTKSISIIAILSDYISSIPAFTNAKESFSQWLEKASTQVQQLDFTTNEQNAIMTYLNKNIRANAHILHFVLTKEAVAAAEKDGIKLFRTVIVENRDGDDADAALAAQRQSEFEAQQRLLEQAMKEKKEAEEKQKQAELAEAIEQIVQENFQKIKEHLEARNDALIQNILALEEKIDGPQKGRKRSD